MLKSTIFVINYFAKRFSASALMSPSCKATSNKAMTSCSVNKPLLTTLRVAFFKSFLMTFNNASFSFLTAILRLTLERRASGTYWEIIFLPSLH